MGTAALTRVAHGPQCLAIVFRLDHDWAASDLYGTVLWRYWDFLPNPDLYETADGASFVLMYVEDGVKLRDLQQVFDPLIEVEQLQIPAAVGHCCEPRHQFADAGAVDVGHLSQVEQDL